MIVITEICLPTITRVVAVGDQAWPMSRIREAGKIEQNDLIIRWSAGQASALDSANIREGRDVGSIVVQRKTEQGLRHEVHDITFAFVFNAFRPEGTLHLD